MPLTPAQQAAIQALRARLDMIPDPDTRAAAVNRITQAIQTQQADQREQTIAATVTAEQADPTWADLITIPGIIIALRSL